MKSIGSFLVALLAFASPAFAVGDSSSGGADGYQFDRDMDCLAEVTQSTNPDLHVSRLVLGQASRPRFKIDMGSMANLATSEGNLEYQLETTYKPGEAPKSRMKRYPAYKPPYDASVDISNSGSGTMELTIGGEVIQVALTDCRKIEATDKLVSLPRPGRVYFGFDGNKNKIDDAKVREALKDLGVRTESEPYQVVVNMLYRMTATFLTPVGKETEVCAKVVAHPYLKQFHVDCHQPSDTAGLARP